MTVANLQQRQFHLFRKFSSEVRPPALLRRDERKRPRDTSFEDIVESEEEDILLPERTSPGGRSPFAVISQSPFAERRGASPQNRNPAHGIKSALRPCRGFSDPGLPSRQLPRLKLWRLSPERHESGSDLMTLPSIPEGDSSSSKDDCEAVR